MYSGKSENVTEYEETLRWLYSLEAAKGMDFKLERVALALERLGDPQRRYYSVHVAGTNGKGSVAAMIHSVLGAAGYRAGLYTSPHLVRFTERIRVGDGEIPPAAVVTLTAEIQNVATSGGIGLTFFEFVTVLSLVHFQRQAVDVAVVEVGLGGRLDATNVLEPKVAAITSIGLDHTEWLGDTIEAVATEKGGVIKPACPLVLAEIGPQATSVLRRLAAERGAPVIEASTFFSVSDQGDLAVRTRDWKLSGVNVGLRGKHQLSNAGTALACLSVIQHVLPVDEQAIRTGLASVRWPGRLDVVATEPLTVLDGAHNPDAMARLAEELPGLLDGRDLHVLFAVMRDKDWRPMVDLLAPLCSSALVTEVLPPRAEAAAVVAEAFRPHCPTDQEPSLERAWVRVRERAGTKGAIVVTGSLFLVGAVLDASRLSPAATVRGLEP